MIGLGSNRMKVGRRAGQDLYYAGGHGGMRIVLSPYSALATAALKAQFPTQWPTIRDYGFQHPALVPFINEDPMLVMSLIEGLGTRWLVGDGTAYIVTAIDCTNILSIECRAKQAVWRYASESFFGSTVDYPMLDLRQNNTLQGIFTKYFRNGTFTNYTAEHVYKMEWPNGMYIDGNASGSPTSVSPDYKPGNLQIFKSMGNTINSDGRFSPLQCDLAYVDLRISGGVKHYFVPCKHNGECGMLDIDDVLWYGNVRGSGSFTISETPAS